MQGEESDVEEEEQMMKAKLTIDDDDEGDNNNGGGRTLFIFFIYFFLTNLTDLFPLFLSLYPEEIRLYIYRYIDICIIYRYIGT
jgi:hypothetical protein